MRCASRDKGNADFGIVVITDEIGPSGKRLRFPSIVTPIGASQASDSEKVRHFIELRIAYSASAGSCSKNWGDPQTFVENGVLRPQTRPKENLSDSLCERQA
jgi:hypothetical protein